MFNRVNNTISNTSSNSVRPPSSTNTQNSSEISGANSDSAQSNSVGGFKKAENLADLPRNRQILLKSKTPVARLLGNKLNELQEGLARGRITPEGHRAECDQLLEEAHELIEGEFLIVCQDLMIQLHTTKGVVANRDRNMQRATVANAGRERAINTIIPIFQSIAWAMGAAQLAVSQFGRSVEQAFDQNLWFSHPQDMDDMYVYARDSAESDGPPAAGPSHEGNDI